VPYVTNGHPTPFVRPPGIVEKVICALSGTEPSNTCKREITEVFASDQPPLPAGQDLVRRVNLDQWTQLEASEACGDFTETETVLNVNDPFARDWLETGDGRAWLEAHDLPRRPIFAPDRECKADDPHPQIGFALNDGDVLTSPLLSVKGTAAATGYFKSWSLDYGLDADPGQWANLTSKNDPVENDTLFNWDLSNIPNGTISLRLTVNGKYASVERVIHLTLSLPTPTPTITPTSPPPTDTPTAPPTDTPVPVPTDTPAPSSTPTATSTP